MDEELAEEQASLFTQEELGDEEGGKEIGKESDHSTAPKVSNEGKANSFDKGDKNNPDQAEGAIATGKNQDDDDNDEDDGSSVGSVSSSQSETSLSTVDSSSSEASLTLQQRQARNIARNERFLGSLREKYQDRLGTMQQEPPNPKGKGRASKTKENRGNGEEADGEDCSSDEENLGMVMKNTHRLFQFSPAGGKPPNGQNDTSDACQNYASGIQALQTRYPHREVQIGRLHAILSATVSLTASVSSVMVHSSASSVYVPAPIFCIGAPGTGKTSVVRDVVGLLAAAASSRETSPALVGSHQPRAMVQPAYVDCSLVEPSTIERLVYTIHKQLKPSSSKLPKETSLGSKSTRHGKKRKRQPASFPLPPRVDLAEEGLNKNNGTDHSQDAKRDSSGSSKRNPRKEEESRVLPSRRAKKAAIHKSLAQNATTFENLQRKRAEGGGSDGEDDDSDAEGVQTLHSAVLSLGRSLQKHYGSFLDDNGSVRNRGFRKKPRCGILVLDKAEELLSLSSASKKGTMASGSGGASNYLSELLLLPKIMKLNLTIVVVTNYCTLHMTRLNNAADPSKALGTISNGVHPIILQFPAYKGNRIFSEILSTADNQNLVMGDSLSAEGSSIMRQSLKDKLVRSFWNTVVQFASDSTRDVRDFQRLGRTLWPSFVAPLHPSVLRKTLEGAAKNSGIDGGLTRAVLSDPRHYSTIEDEVVRLLGNRFYPRVAAMASGDDSLTLLILDEDGILPVVSSSRASGSSVSASIDSSGSIVQNPDLGATPSVPLPYLRSCLLLAAFVCQHNKADHDRKLFSVHGNGRRRKSKAKEDIYGGNDEDLAFGSTNVTQHSGRGQTKGQHQVEQLKTLKLRPVPLERVFSIFVTLVRLNPSSGREEHVFGDGSQDEDLEGTMNDLGSSRLYRDLSHLADLGYFHLAKGNQPVHLAPPRILCSLTRDEALEISDRIGIPLERYLI